MQEDGLFFIISRRASGQGKPLIVALTFHLVLGLKALWSKAKGVWRFK